MSENTNTLQETEASTQTLQDFKHAILILSMTINLALFTVWVLALAGVGIV